MDTADPGVPYDPAAAAAQALRDLGQVPGDDPVVQLEHVVTLLLASSAKLLAGAIESSAGDGQWDTKVLEHLERLHMQFLNGLAPPTANPARQRRANPQPPDSGPGRPGGWGCDWQHQPTTDSASTWRTPLGSGHADRPGPH